MRQVQKTAHRKYNILEAASAPFMINAKLSWRRYYPCWKPLKNFTMYRSFSYNLILLLQILLYMEKNKIRDGFLW